MLNSIPKQILSQHIAILGKTGSGKTYAAKGMAERLLAAKERVCIIDPTGAWWGLRSNTTGKASGFPIMVFGGEHGDLPIERHHGQSIAEIIATTETSAVIDTRLMTVGERTQFFTDFAETLLRKNAGMRHLIIDEAHVFAPQGRVADPQSGKMLHAANNLVSLGRGRGLRITLISQRPAKLHKDSLTQVEALIAMRLIAPQDRNAVEDWVLEWADPKLGAELLKSLPSLPTGEGWIWAPEIGILDRAKFPPIATYDSSRAPDGASSKVVLATIDLPAIEAKLKTVAADLAGSDPKRLRARIAELEAEAKKKPAAPGFTAEDVAAARAAVEEEARCQFIEAMNSVAVSLDHAKNVLQQVQRDFEYKQKRPAITGQTEPPKPVSLIAASPPPRVNGKSTSANGPGNSMVGNSGLRRILVALAQRNGLSAKQIGVRAGISSSSGTFATYLGTARSNDWIIGSRNRLEITKDGLRALGSYEPLPTGRDLQDHWLSVLGSSGAARMLRCLANAYPKAVSAAQLGEVAEISSSSGTFATYLGKLRSLELIEGSRDALRASEELF
jgi:uncharacterized protein